MTATKTIRERVINAATSLKKSQKSVSARSVVSRLKMQSNESRIKYVNIILNDWVKQPENRKSYEIATNTKNQRYFRFVSNPSQISRPVSSVRS